MPFAMSLGEVMFHNMARHRGDSVLGIGLGIDKVKVLVKLAYPISLTTRL